jgi:hypothetical protein
MQDHALYPIQEARKLLGGISRDTIYHLLRMGRLASAPPAEAVAHPIARSTTTVSPRVWRRVGRWQTSGPSLLPCLRQFAPESTEWKPGRCAFASAYSGRLDSPESKARHACCNE